MTPQLIVSLNSAAVLRDVGHGNTPEPVELALIAEASGAAGVSIGFREDKRFVKDRDLRLLTELVKTRFDLEIPPNQDMVKAALELKPCSVTIRPALEDDFVSEHGLDVSMHREKIEKAIVLLRESGIDVIVFVDADIEQIRSAQRLGVEHIELNAFRFVQAGTIGARQREREKLTDAVRLLKKLNMCVTVSGGLNTLNIRELLGESKVDAIKVSRSIFAAALLHGMDRAVRDMVSSLKRTSK